MGLGSRAAKDDLNMYSGSGDKAGRNFQSLSTVHWVSCFYL